MADRQWYTAIGGKQEGPFSDARLRELVGGGTVTADTWVWCDGMTDWAKAAAIPGLLPPTRRPPQMPAGPSAQRPGATGALATTVRTWPLLGRSLLLFLAGLVIIPLPWAATSYYRWFIDHIELPQQQRIAFVGKPGDIWYVFMANALCGYIGMYNSLLQIALIFLTTLLNLIILRWVLANIDWQGRPGPLQFTGSYWAMLGWTLLAAISVITIIGWAWVGTAWLRWICDHVSGAVRKVTFTGSGWSLLWRSFAFALTALLIVPIPWMLHWYVRWFVSQFALGSAGAELARAGNQ